MAGFSSVTGDEAIMFADNASFDGTQRGGKMTTDGQLWIGSTAARHVKLGSITSPLGTLSIGYSSPNITLDIAGGSAALEHLTPDSGGQINPVANNINVFGYPAGASQVMKTFNVAGSLKIADQTFLSRYVVDTNTTAGQAGTYSTLQSAITQAIIDGATGTGACIYIRNCTINETITVSTAGVNIFIIGTSSMSNPNINSAPIFSGSFTNSGTGSITFANLSITGTLTNSSTGTISVNNSIISGTLVNSNALGTISCTNCFCSAITGTLSRGVMQFYYCNLSGGTITCSNDVQPKFYYSSVGVTLTGSTSASVAFNNSYIPLTANNLSSGNMLNFNSTFDTFDYYTNSNVTYLMKNTTAGNTYQAVRSAVSYIVLANQDFYIGITDTGSARTVTLPSTNIIKNQSFIVKDESGGAATHNISVTVAGGVKTIDGVTTYAINTNYGSIQVIYDGTNYFIM